LGSFTRCDEGISDSSQLRGCNLSFKTFVVLPTHAYNCTDSQDIWQTGNISSNMADHDLERGAIPQREIEDALAVETTVEGPSRPLQTDGPATDNVDGKAPSGTKIEGTETPGHRRHSDSDERGSNVSSDYPSSQSERSAHSYSRDIFFDEHATNVGSVVPSKNKLVFSPTSRPSSETYFVELANFCLRADNLPSIKISRQSKLWRISDEDYPQIHALYEGTEEQPELLPSHFESLAGFALALRKWESLDKAHMEAEMKEEFALIAEKKTTNREQIERLRKLARYREGIIEALDSLDYNVLIVGRES